MKKAQNRDDALLREAAAANGFSTVEVVMVIVVSLIVATFAIVQMQPMLQEQQANAAMNLVMSQLRTARELAITERRNIQVQFIGANQIQLTRMNLPAGQSLISAVIIPGQVQFMLSPGVPDTPDGFGNAGPIEFGGIVGGPPTMLFQSDGTFVDTAGNLLNGTVFLGIPGLPAAARAVTLLGSTGRVRTYRATPSGWIE